MRFIQNNHKPEPSSNLQRHGLAKAQAAAIEAGQASPKLAKDKALLKVKRVYNPNRKRGGGVILGR